MESKLQFKNKVGMKCKIYLTSDYQEDDKRWGECVYGIIGKVDVLKDTYTVYEPDLKESVTYNMSVLHVDLVDEEFTPNEVDKHLTNNDNGKQFYSLNLNGIAKTYYRKLLRLN